MRLFRLLFLFALPCGVFLSCSGKKKSPETPAETAKPDSSGTTLKKSGDLSAYRAWIDKELAAWAASFEAFSPDSFTLTQEDSFSLAPTGEDPSSGENYALFAPSLVYAPDSSAYLDLFSAGMMLEKKGKKIIATSDVDQAVNLYNRQTREWNRIVSFGPSAGIEEAVWTSADEFLLAGIFFNDNGQATPILIAGNKKLQTLRWYGSSQVRPGDRKYESSGIVKLKIDEWE